MIFHWFKYLLLRLSVIFHWFKYFLVRVSVIFHWFKYLLVRVSVTLIWFKCLLLPVSVILPWFMCLPLRVSEHFILFYVYYCKLTWICLDLCVYCCELKWICLDLCVYCCELNRESNTIDESRCYTYHDFMTDFCSHLRTSTRNTGTKVLTFVPTAGRRVSSWLNMGSCPHCVYDESLSNQLAITCFIRELVQYSLDVYWAEWCTAYTT